MFLISGTVRHGRADPTPNGRGPATYSRKRHVGVQRWTDNGRPCRVDIRVDKVAGRDVATERVRAACQNKVAVKQPSIVFPPCACHLSCRADLQSCEVKVSQGCFALLLKMKFLFLLYLCLLCGANGSSADGKFANDGSPARVRVSGFSTWLHGWNGMLNRTADGRYVSAQRMLFGVLSVADI